MRRSRMRSRIASLRVGYPLPALLRSNASSKAVSSEMLMRVRSAIDRPLLLFRGGLRFRERPPNAIVGNVSVWEGEAPAESGSPAPAGPRPPHLTHAPIGT